MMLLIPAIDLKDGHCVRLRQGRMDDSTVFSNDPVQMAGRWVNKGARRLHIVDLNGAFVGGMVNAEIVTAITSAYPAVVVQIGGGIRDMQSVQFYIDAGVNYVIIGTQAVKEPEFVREACLAYPGQIIVGVDAINGKVATDGWTDVSALNAIELAQKFAGFGVAAIIYTDISRDGMMKGVNVEATVELAEKSSIPVIASGGIAKLADIVDLKVAANITTGAGIIGAITGRALYEGELDLKEAQAYCDGPYG